MIEVEVVINHWKRPANVTRIVERFRQQTVPCLITVCDAASAGLGLDEAARRNIDRLYRFENNFGPYTRFIPAFNYNCTFTYFHDDDMLPGRNVLDHFLRAAEERPDGAMFGQIGRRAGARYDPTDIPRHSTEFLPVDLLVRGYFVRTEYLTCLKRFQLRLGIPSPREDDMLIAIGIQSYTNKSILLTPLESDAEEKMNVEELSAPDALSAAPDHYVRREAFWQTVKSLSAQIREEEGDRVALRRIQWSL